RKRSGRGQLWHRQYGILHRPAASADHRSSVHRQRYGRLQRSRIPRRPEFPAGTADLVLAKYPPGPDPQATYDLVTPYPGACRNRHIDALWAQAGLPVYAYEFNDQHAPYYYPPMPGFTPLAAHTIDIQFLFPLWHGG